MRSYLLPLLRQSLRSLGAPENTEIVLDLPRAAERGDITIGVAFALARHLEKKPLEIARDILAHLAIDPEIVTAGIAGAGFINFHFTPKFLHHRLDEALRLGDNFGRSAMEYRSRNATTSPLPEPPPADPRRISARSTAITNLLNWTGHDAISPPANQPAPPENDIEPDVATFFFLMRERTARMDFDAELARDHSEKNPFRYIQYALARAAGILRHAELEQIGPTPEYDLSLLQHPRELALTRQIILLPEIILRAAHELEPAILARYLHDLSTAFNDFHHECRVLPEPPPLRNARLHLITATQIAIRNGLQVLGIEG